MRYASVDIGTNTLRLLVADTNGADKDGADKDESGKGGLRPVLYKRAITRLGGDYTSDAGLAPASMERTVEALRGFRDEIDRLGVDKVIATATSVVRRAKNREDFLRDAARKARLEVEVIDGQEEARLSLLGVHSVVGTGGSHLVFDIGGGSTEYIIASGGELLASWSLDLGVVHLAEEHLLTDPPTEVEVLAMEAEVRVTIEDLAAKMLWKGVEANPVEGAGGAGGATTLVGTAGTVTTLAAIDMDLSEYDRERINNHRITKQVVAEIYGRLLAMTMAERGEILSLEKGREDLIIPGAAIVLITMERFGFDELIVSDAGLLEGLILRESTRY